LEQTTAPLDGMWLRGFVPIATHFGFYENEELVGYCCINDDNYLLQFHLCPENQNQAFIIFDSILTQNNSPIEEIKGAFVSTAEPLYLSLCLDGFSNFEVNALMYQLDKNLITGRNQESELQLKIVKPDQLAEVVKFENTNIGAPEEWLTDYNTNLINREEVLGYWENGRLLAIGECRESVEYQTDYADLGVIVDASMRGKGYATKILKQLVTRTEAKGLKPICSTEKTNIGAQKAISRAGFFAGHRIIQFEF